MNKVRVYEVARELGLENAELVKKMANLGIQVKNHMSSLDETDVDRLKSSIEKEKTGAVVKERINATVIRRRTVAAPTPAAPVAAKPEPAPVVTRLKQPPAKVEAPTEILPPPPPPPPVVVAPPPPPAHLATKPEPSRAPVEVVAEPAAPPPPAPAAAAPVEPQPTSSARRSSPPSFAERLGHANLPPGVLSRGNSVAPPSGLSREAAQRIAAEHAPRGVPGQGGTPQRRVEITRGALGPTGRQPPAGRAGGIGRPGKKLPPGKKGAKPEITVPSAQKRVIRIEESIGLQTLASRMSLKATDVLMKLIQLGMMGVNINSTLDAETAKILASEFHYEVENVAKSEDEVIVEARGTFEDREKDRKLRPPVVTVMGHVDHGKTSLLDRIRNANVVKGEAGGITQHIGAYRVETPKGIVVFLDTPGHEAFTAMRARGGHAADVVILVVAADDGVMPQTKEAINHARAAQVPLVVAVNKVDKPEARPEAVRRELANEGLQPEEWGGDTMFLDVSAKSGAGIDQLLTSVALQAEVLELTANPKIPAEGLVLEAYLDKGRGPVANVLVRNGTLHTGDIVIAGAAWGKVRAMTDDRGKPVTAAGPSTPVEVLGLSEVPGAGDSVYVVTDQKKAQEIAESRSRTKAAGRSMSPSSQAKIGLDQIYAKMQAGEVQEMRLVIKGDVSGSVEAVVKALTDLSTDKVKVVVIHTGVGGITENDVMLASASNAIVIGFNVRPAGAAAATAKSEGVDVRLYNIIYEAVDEVKKAMTGLLAPTYVEKQLGRAEIRQVFAIPKAGTVAGTFVLDGKLTRGGKVRIVRDSVQIWDGKVATLRRFKDDVRDVAAGFECGVTLEGYNDVKEKDILEAYELEAVAGVL
jgi:translation initiation factor IF-2